MGYTSLRKQELDLHGFGIHTFSFGTSSTIRKRMVPLPRLAGKVRSLRDRKNTFCIFLPLPMSAHN